MPRYVQHKSGQGEKWKLLADCNTGWRVRNPHNKDDWYLLPKSDYVLCAPPEPTWKDVTKDCAIRDDGTIAHDGVLAIPAMGYRRRLLKLVAADRGPWGSAWFHKQMHVIVIEKAVYEE